MRPISSAAVSALVGLTALVAQVALASSAHATSTGHDGGGVKPFKLSSGGPRDARITIPSLHIERLPVLAYRGRTDDGPGTAIQNRGIAASPYGPHGGVGPGGLGN